MSLLNEHDIETVVEICELPLSRKPGFSKKALANVLNLSGLSTSIWSISDAEAGA